MKKSEIIIDLTKIKERLDALLSSTYLENAKDELSAISSQIENINTVLQSDCITFSITGRALIKKKSECRFCGK